MKELHIQQTFQAKLGGRFPALLELENTQEMTDVFNEVINEAAIEVLGKEKKKKQPWMTTEILDKCDERRKLKAVKYKDYDLERKYRELKNKVWTAIRDAKEVFIETKCKEVQQWFENYKTPNSHSMW